MPSGAFWGLPGLPGAFLVPVWSLSVAFLLPFWCLLVPSVAFWSLLGPLEPSGLRLALQLALFTLIDKYRCFWLVVQESSRE